MKKKIILKVLLTLKAVALFYLASQIGIEKDLLRTSLFCLSLSLITYLWFIKELGNPYRLYFSIIFFILMFLGLYFGDLFKGETDALSFFIGLILIYFYIQFSKK